MAQPPPTPLSPGAQSHPSLESGSFNYTSIYHQPTWSAASTAADGPARGGHAGGSAATAATAATAPILLESVAFKGTRLSGVMVRRRVALIHGGRTIATYHHPDVPAAAQRSRHVRHWHLDRGCRLRPASSGELVAAGPSGRGVRQAGTWAITAAIQGVDSSVELYEFAIDWPPRWAASGYTTLVLGFTQQATAVAWHDAVAGVVARMRAAKGAPKGGGGEAAAHPAAAAAAAPGDEALAEAAAAAAASGAEAADGDSGGSGGGSHAEGDAAGGAGDAAADQARMLGQQGTRQHSRRIAPYDSATAPYDSMWHDAESDVESDQADSDVDSETGGEASDAAEPPPPPPDGERWIPYRQTNGVAIYYHQAEDGRSGGEYMVSCVVRGRPHRVAAALMRLRGNTTILGPAAHAEVLQPAGEAAGGGGGGDGKEVLRLVLTATGTAGLVCAPREMVVETMKKDDEDGVICVMFKSVDLPPAVAARDKGARPRLYGSGLFRRPVRGCVAGGYTVAGLRGEGAASQESLITCIVKVDLGGVCGASSWLRPLSFVMGWGDAFLDRILMSVHLIRDEVEQRRFSVQPFELVASAKARINEAGRLVGDPQAERAQQIGAVGAPLPSRMASVRLPAQHSAAIAAAVAGAAAGGAAAASGRLAMGAAEAEPEGEAPRAEAEAAPAPAGSDAYGGAAAEGPGAAPPPPAAAAVAAAPPPLNLEYIQSLSLLPRRYWSEIHVPGADAPFRVRGATYLKDKKKVPAGQAAFSLGAVEMIVLPPPGTRVGGGGGGTRRGTGSNRSSSSGGGDLPGTPGVVEHVGRFLPSVRQGGAPFSIVIHLVIPGSPLLGIVAVFCCDKHPSILGRPPANPMDEPHDWQPFDFVLHKFVYGDDATRNTMLKLIPHIAAGPWMIKQSVGTTPVILGKALKTTYHCTPTYIEIDIDISANSVANYVTGMVRGATSSLDIDIGIVLEGTAPWELPECLLGCFRVHRLDTARGASAVDWSRELPLLVPP